MERKSKPNWWQLYLLLPIMFVLIAIESIVPLRGISNNIVDAGIVVLFFVSVLGWVHINGGLLERYYIEQDGGYDLKITVYEPASKTKNDENNGRDLTPYAMSDSAALVRLEEKEKWSHNFDQPSYHSWS